MSTYAVMVIYTPTPETYINFLTVCPKCINKITSMFYMKAVVLCLKETLAVVRDIYRGMNTFGGGKGYL